MKQHLNTAAGKKKMTSEEKQRLRQIEESNQMITLPEAEMDLYARLILYTAQKDLFDLIVEETGRDDIEWTDYICAAVSSEDEVDALLRVISFGVTERFCSGCFNFMANHVEFLRKGDMIPEDGTLKLIRLCRMKKCCICLFWYSVTRLRELILSMSGIWRKSLKCSQA